MNEEKSLRDHGIQKDATIELLLRLKGGMDEENSKLEFKEELKKKRTIKMRLTRARNSALEEIKERSSVKSKGDHYEEKYEETIQYYENLIDLGEKKELKEEVDELKKELRIIEENYEKYGDLIEEDTSMSIRTSSPNILAEVKPKKKLRMFSPLKVPTFGGSVKEFEIWRTTFRVTVVDTDASDEEKLLYLKLSLVGEPLKLIENIGFGPHALQTALRRLEERYGREDRIFQTLMEEVRRFKPIKTDETKELDEYIRLIEEIVLKLKNQNRCHNLENGFLYNELLKRDL